jgi:uncharacterized protein (DUF983 family)
MSLNRFTCKCGTELVFAFIKTRPVCRGCGAQMKPAKKVKTTDPVLKAMIRSYNELHGR